MFLKIIFIYFLLLCKVLNTQFCLSKLGTRLMFHWKAIFIFSSLHLCSLLLLHGDIKSNPGPRNSKIIYPHFVTGTLINILIYAIYKYNFLCLSETYLDSSIPSDHVSLDLEGHKLVCTDHPNNIKQGGVCIYYKESPPVKVINLPVLQEVLLLELNDQNKK